MISLDVAKRLAQALRPSTPDVAETSGGVVTRLDNDGTVWVQLHGADEDTPCTSRTAAVHVGDAVTVTIDGGSARVDGNVTRPATDDERAEEAHELAAQATEEVSEVRETATATARLTAIANGIAEQAQAVADAIGQHFFADTQGVHVTEAEGDPTTEHNILINSLGILLRKAAIPLVSITEGAIAFYDGVDSAEGNIMASFGPTLARIGKAAESHLDLTATGIKLSVLFNNALRDALSVVYETVNGSIVTYVRIGANDGDGTVAAKVGGGSADVVNGALTWRGSVSLSTPLAAASGGTGITDYGTYLVNDDDSGVSVANNAWTTVNQLTLDKGRWLLRYVAEFPSNATGWRGCGISTATDSIGAANLRQSGITVPATNGAGTRLNGSRIVNPTGTTTYYLVVRQNSGSALTTTSYIQAVKIG